MLFNVFLDPMKTLLLVISIFVNCGMNSVNLRVYKKTNSLNFNTYHLGGWVGVGGLWGDHMIFRPN